MPTARRGPPPTNVALVELERLGRWEPRDRTESPDPTDTQEIQDHPEKMLTKTLNSRPTTSASNASHHLPDLLGLPDPKEHLDTMEKPVI